MESSKQDSHLSRINAYRKKQRESFPPIFDLGSAKKYVDTMGYIFFWPILGFDYPSLWHAVAGDRPVTYDDPANVTWSWKDQSLSAKIWYYSKLVRKKATFVSLAVAPFFYALTDNFGDPDTDHLQQYSDGRMTHAAKNVYEALLAEGPLHTIDLKKKAKLQSASADSEFNRAMEQLQCDMKVVPVGIAQAGAWRYSFIYDLVHRQFPEIPNSARTITESCARAELVRIYLTNVGGVSLQQANKFFAWQPHFIKKTLDQLSESGFLFVTKIDGKDMVLLKSLI